MLHYKLLDGCFITSQILSDMHVQTKPGYLQAGQSGYCSTLCTHKMNKENEIVHVARTKHHEKNSYNHYTGQI